MKIEAEIKKDYIDLLPKVEVSCSIDQLENSYLKEVNKVSRLTSAIVQEITEEDEELEIVPT